MIGHFCKEYEFQLVSLLKKIKEKYMEKKNGLVLIEEILDLYNASYINAKDIFSVNEVINLPINQTL